MSEKFYKRMYTAGEFYGFLVDAARTIKYVNHAKKHKVLDEGTTERIMLAVTEVNGCELCSYIHTEAALKQGMTQEEINGMLSGEDQHIPEEDSIAIFFAQHYAEQKGKPSREAWDRLVETYGKRKAYGILGAIRGIMVGNTHGIAVSAFSSRLKGQKIEKSNIAYELGMMLVIVPFLPLAIVHGMILSAMNKPLIQL